MSERTSLSRDAREVVALDWASVRECPPERCGRMWLCAYRFSSSSPECRRQERPRSRRVSLVSFGCRLSPRTRSRSLCTTALAREASTHQPSSVAAYALIFALARTLLGSGVSVIVEANFFRDQEQEFATLPEHRLVQLHCEAPLAILLERYANRPRHAGHHDSEKIGELPARFERGAHDALKLPGDLIELDTTEPVDLDALADRIRALS